MVTIYQTNARRPEITPIEVERVDSLYFWVKNEHGQEINRPLGRGARQSHYEREDIAIATALAQHSEWIVALNEEKALAERNVDALRKAQRALGRK